MVNKRIKEYLNEVDKSTTKFIGFSAERIISKTIDEICKEYPNEELDEESLAEHAAFNFHPDYKNEETGWGTYYGPKFVLPSETGQMVESPSIQKIYPRTIEYWKNRADTSNHPVLVSRYSDLVVDFSKRIRGFAPEGRYFRNVVLANMKICNQRISTDIDCINKGKRAVHLAIMMRDDDLIDKTAKSLISLEKNIAQDNKPGLWGFSMRTLINSKNRDKINLSEIVVESLVKEIENRLERSKNDVRLTEICVSLLSEYYAHNTDEENLRRVLSILEMTYKEDERMNSEPLLQLNAYEQLIQRYQRFEDDYPFARNARIRLYKEMSSLNPDWERSMKKNTSSVEIPRENLEAYNEYVFGTSETPRPTIDIMSRIGILFIPKQEDIKKQLQDTARKSPFSFLISNRIISEDGYLVASISSLDEDYDKHFQKFVGQNLAIQSFFLGLVTDKLKKVLSLDEINKYFKSSFLFVEEDHELLEKALISYWDGNFLVSSHLLIPMIERVIRNFVRVSGGNILKPNNLGGNDVILLHTLLYRNEEIFKVVFGEIGENLTFYLSMVLTKKLGMNLRNDWGHGINISKFKRQDASDRLFHIMTILSLVSENKTSDG